MTADIAAAEAKSALVIWERNEMRHGNTRVNVDKVKTRILQAINNKQTRLDLSGLGLKTVPPLHGLGKLIDLDLGDNQLTTLEPDTFNGLSNLEKLNLHNNQLTTLDADIFNGLGNLIDLYLHNSQLTTLDADIFNGLSNLEKLYLGNNQLTTLEPGTFNGLDNLIDLYLGDNQLTTLDADIFNVLGKLNYLNLQNNQLTTLEPGTFNGLSTLEYLYLERNRFSENAVSYINDLFSGSLTRITISIYDPLNQGRSLGNLSLSQLLTGLKDKATKLGITTNLKITFFQDKEDQLHSFKLFLQKLPMMNDWGKPSFTIKLLQTLFNILEAMSESDEILSLMEGIACEATDTCGDRVALGFMKMALSQSAPSKETLNLRSLFNYAQAMSRLEMIEKIAQEKVRSLTGAIDEIEVVLKYIKDLNEPLDLGLPLHSMLYESFSQVNNEDIENAKKRIKEAEPNSIYEWMVDYPMARSITDIEKLFETLESSAEFNIDSREGELEFAYVNRAKTLIKTLKTAKINALKKLYPDGIGSTSVN